MRGLLLAATAFLLISMARAAAFSVFMTGDSHVSSRVYPERVGDILVDADPEIEFDYHGKAGAGFYSFNDEPSLMRRIYAAEPDILIVHLGTNDSYTRRFDSGKFTADISEFYRNVREHCPEALVVFVTPFYNKLKGSREVNGNTRACSDAILEFAKGKEGVYVIDNNADHGMDFLNGGHRLISHDNVHLTPEGYKELGDQVGQALIDIEDLWTNSL